MPAKHDVSRCAQCGTILTDLAKPLGKCPKCAFDLHSCKQCNYFDPGSRFECMQPVLERVAQKDAVNLCRFYQIRVMVERETTSGRPAPASGTGPNRNGGSKGNSAGSSALDTARRALDRLFKS